MMKKIAFALLLCLQSSLFAAPFGLKMGMTAEEVSSLYKGIKPIESKDDWYYIEPEKKHYFFERYKARIDKKFGLYYVRATSFDIKTDGYGTSVKQAFLDIKNKLSKIYGEPQFIDELDPNYENYYTFYDQVPHYQKEDNWLKSIEDDVRTYECVWSDTEKMPSDTLMIKLFVEIQSSSKANLVLDYELANLKDAINKALENL